MQLPNIIEPLNFEEIFSRMKEELIRRDSSFTALIESDPAIKILEIAAWRELLLRERINEAAKANLLKFTEGNDLDCLAEFYGVERKEKEEDENFRKRIKAKGWSTGGSKEHYRYHALSADSRVKDALVESLVPGKVQVSILFIELSTETEDLLKIVRNQLNREDIPIIEEPPFAEFQVGICCSIPNDSLINAVIDLAKLAAPARSRLMRIFNDLYNAQRFILNESLFGDLLSDYSGVRVEKEGPVFSFGRKNSFELKLANPSFKFGTFRAHYERSFSNYLYRLDIAILGDTEPYTKNYSGIYERDHLWYNFKALYPLPQSLLPAIKFTKAQIVLSDSWKLGEVNGCFPVSYHEEAGDKFLLGNDKLSEQLCSFKYTPILERFSINYQYEAKNFDDQKAIKYGLAEHYTCLESNFNQNQDGPTHELENHILVFYSGVIVWHEHKHLNRSWNNTQPTTLIY